MPHAVLAIAKGLGFIVTKARVENKLRGEVLVQRDEAAVIINNTCQGK